MKKAEKSGIILGMCPNCVLNQAGAWPWIGPGLICLLFMVFAGYFMLRAKQDGEFKGDEEDPKYSVFDES